MKKDELIRMLRSSQGGYVSGTELASALGVSRAAVWKQVRALARAGFAIDAVPSKGYRLTAAPDVVLPGDITRDLGTAVIGGTIRYEDEIPSTNTLAMELAHAGAAEGTVVLAEAQSGGRGRLGREWFSPRGNMYFSVILRPPIPPSRAPLLTLMGAVASASAIRSQTGVAAGIKWPNDLLINGKKAAGILTEMSAEPDRIRYVVLGIGVNANMDPALFSSEVRRTATTLALEAGMAVDRTDLLRRMLLELDHWYGRFRDDAAGMLAAWRLLNVTLGNRIRVSGAGPVREGLARDVDEEGRLILELDDGTGLPVAAGDVTIVAAEEAAGAARGEACS